MWEAGFRIQKRPTRWILISISSIRSRRIQVHQSTSHLRRRRRTAALMRTPRTPTTTTALGTLLRCPSTTGRIFVEACCYEATSQKQRESLHRMEVREGWFLPIGAEICSASLKCTCLFNIFTFVATNFKVSHCQIACHWKDPVLRWENLLTRQPLLVLTEE